MEDSGTGDSNVSGRTATGGNDAARQGRRAGAPRPQGLARYARPALIAGAVIAVVCIALLVIIFFLDSFNATVYSVGGKNVQDATDEARSIRDTYAAARLGGIIFLVIGVLLAAAGGWLLYRHRNDEGQEHGRRDGEDVDFEDLAGRVAAARPLRRTCPLVRATARTCAHAHRHFTERPCLGHVRMPRGTCPAGSRQAWTCARCLGARRLDMFARSTGHVQSVSARPGHNAHSVLRAAVRTGHVPGPCQACTWFGYVLQRG